MLRFELGFYVANNTIKMSEMALYSSHFRFLLIQQINCLMLHNNQSFEKWC